MPWKTTSRRLAKNVVPARLHPLLRRSATAGTTDPATVTETEVVQRNDVDGPVMLSALIDSGLRPDHTVVDLDAGGPLAEHLISYLTNGRYIGMLHTAVDVAGLSNRFVPMAGSCEVTIREQEGTTFDLPEASVDFFVADDLFTRIDQEDWFLYLRAARPIARDTARVVFGCLTMDTGQGRSAFVHAASIPSERRRNEPHTVTTTYEHVQALAKLAGWRIRSWYRGDRAMVPVVSDPGQRIRSGQSICVLQP